MHVFAHGLALGVQGTRTPKVVRHAGRTACSFARNGALRSAIPCRVCSNWFASVSQPVFFDLQSLAQTLCHGVGIRAAAAFIIADHVLSNTQLACKLGLGQPGLQTSADKQVAKRRLERLLVPGSSFSQLVKSPGSWAPVRVDGFLNQSYIVPAPLEIAKDRPNFPLRNLEETAACRFANPLEVRGDSLVVVSFVTRCS